MYNAFLRSSARIVRRPLNRVAPKWTRPLAGLALDGIGGIQQTSKRTAVAKPGSRISLRLCFQGAANRCPGRTLA